MITVTNLTKRYRGGRLAVDDLSFTAESGTVTGFLGPNGAGKSTTMRAILGLDHPTDGETRVNGKHFSEIRHPLREIGALLDASHAPGHLTARQHLRWLSQAGRISPTRSAEVLELVGLSESANRRIREFSLGMRQRLGIAAALLGDPSTIMLDEPVNGLDPGGIRWMNQFTKELAADGRTVLVSSHQMIHAQEMADHVVIIASGTLRADTSMDDLLAGAAGEYVIARCREPGRFERALVLGGARIAQRQATGDSTEFRIEGLSPSQIGELADSNRIPLTALVPHTRRLEDVFLDLVADPSNPDNRRNPDRS